MCESVRMSVCLSWVDTEFKKADIDCSGLVELLNQIIIRHLYSRIRSCNSLSPSPGGTQTPFTWQLVTTPPRVCTDHMHLLSTVERTYINLLSHKHWCIHTRFTTCIMQLCLVNTYCLCWYKCLVICTATQYTNDHVKTMYAFNCDIFFWYFDKKKEDLSRDFSRSM